MKEMKKRDYSTIENDIQILQQLRQEQAANLNELRKRLLLRKKKRALRISLSTAAAVIALSMLILNWEQNGRKMNEVAMIEQNDIKTPTIVFSGGDKMELSTEKNSKTFVVANIPQSSEREKKSPPDKLNQLIIPSGYSGKFLLEDGTEVMLNAGSTLSYPEHFSDTKREVFLTGEAYFKVKKSKIPFIVSTTYADIKVYGTEFNINCNRRDVFETVLVNGSVGVTSKIGNSTEEVKIKPNQLLSLAKENGESRLTKVDITPYIGWTQGNFIFDYDSLVDLLDEMSMWYGVRFDFDTDAIAKEIVTINVNRTVALESLLEIIREMTNVKFIKEGRSHYSIEMR